MKLSGSVTFPTARHHVWNILTDPDKLSRCMPGLDKWELLQADQTFHLTINWGNSKHPVHIPVELRWTESTPPQWLKMSGHAFKGNATIHATGEINLLALNHQETEAQFTAVFTTANKIWAQIIRSNAPKVIDTFFHCLKQSLING